jgi:sugar O-acyltransferase (sialic acid O-acetyltransferase NeuD family)
MKLAIYGSGGIGQEVFELASIIQKHEYRWEEVVFVDDSFSNDQQLLKYSFDKLSKLSQSLNEYEFVIAVGEPAIRAQLYDKVKEKGYKFVTLVHPNSYVSENAQLEEGVVVCYGSFISHHVKLHHNVYIQPNVVIGHDTTIYSHSIISPGVSIGGAVNIGNSCFVGLNACIREKITVGFNSIIGMGCSLNKNVEDNTVVTGNPSKVVGKNRMQRVFMENQHVSKK